MKFKIHLKYHAHVNHAGWPVWSCTLHRNFCSEKAAQKFLKTFIKDGYSSVEVVKNEIQNS